MFIDFSPAKKSHIKPEIMKSLKTRNKSPVHYKYTWQRCTNQSYLFAEGFCGQRLGRSAQCGHHGHATLSLWPPGTHPAAAGRSGALTPYRTVLAPCQCHSHPLECIELRTCPGSGTRISASRFLNALGAWMGPIYQVWSATLSDEGISSSFEGFSFFLMQLFNLSS